MRANEKLANEMYKINLIEELYEIVKNPGKVSKENIEKKIELVIEKGINPIDVLNNGLLKGLREIGDQFGRGDAFLPELMGAANIVEKAMKILKPQILKLKLEKGLSMKRSGVIVIGTVQGDIHDLGKNIVATMLKTYGFEVYDIGVNVPVDTFIAKALHFNANIIGTSALLTTTLYEQKKLIETLREKGLKGRFKVVVGGAPVTEDWAKNIGADGFAENAFEAVKVVSELIE